MPRHAADSQPDPSIEPPTDPTFSIPEARSGGPTSGEPEVDGTAYGRADGVTDHEPDGRADHEADGGTESKVTSARTVRVLAYMVGLALLIAGATAVTFGNNDSTDPAAAARDDQRGSRSEVRTTPTVDAAIGAAPTPSAVPTTPPAPPATTPPAVKKAAPKVTAAAPPKVSAGCGKYSGNRLIACNLLPSFGFSTSEMAALDPMWNNESGWNASAENPGSGAYGIPQSLPGSKMASAGGDWRTNPATQIKWGLDYIKGRYGSPSAAWSYWQANGWY